jgi:hypothetical protein
MIKIVMDKCPYAIEESEQAWKIKSNLVDGGTMRDMNS